MEKDRNGWTNVFGVHAPLAAAPRIDGLDQVQVVGGVHAKPRGEKRAARAGILGNYGGVQSQGSRREMAYKRASTKLHGNCVTPTPMGWQ